MILFFMTGGNLANNFPEFLYTLIFQIEYKILLHNSNVDTCRLIPTEVTK
jgi:hypothetical protein